MNYEAPLTPKEREELINRLTELIGANSQEEVIDEALIYLYRQRNSRGALLRMLTERLDEQRRGQRSPKNHNEMISTELGRA